MSTSSTQRGTFAGEVLANELICDNHYRMILDLAGFPPTRPGQFIQLLCRPPGEQASFREIDWPADRPPTFTQPELTDRETMLRRPLSLAGRRDHARGAVELDLLYRISGTGTRWLSGAEPGRTLSLLGPLGNAFALWPEKPIAALVGGGVGIPPMLYLAEALAAAGKTVVAFNGARTAALLPLRLLPAGHVSTEGRPARCVAEFATYGAQAVVATEDASLGFAGLVSEPFARWLAEQTEAAANVAAYACGPEPMMQAVAEICRASGVRCEVSLERHMACGMGTCQSCICKLRADNQRGWAYRLCCTDGPVFDAQQIIWD